ncbi:hypothetical protein [Mesobacillus foraminis]|uniref:Uncharacterized protein n=1 Tax=Mesobacillus foraminis TaxID=279826 RepID=A0A4R2BCK8_9BACI|nr:hypothetical protein [Mesobacillus foraminis]TCN24155.1 hypothetical protein EV146_108269 [Mesobacillus foraminis]
MDKKEYSFNFRQEQFFDLIRRTYEKGLNDQEMTVEKLLKDLQIDLKNTIVK